VLSPNDRFRPPSVTVPEQLPPEFDATMLSASAVGPPPVTPPVASESNSNSSIDLIASPRPAAVVPAAASVKESPIGAGGDHAPAGCRAAAKAWFGGLQWYSQPGGR
jgi:hypothetical protein